MSEGVSESVKPFMRALAAIRAHVVEVGPGARLPSLRRMAAEAGVAVSTMGRALRRLAVDGEVSIVGRGGAFAGPVPLRQTDGATTGRLGASDAVRERLLSDILGGRYAPGTLLPAYKELIERLGGSYGTMRRALVRLEHEGRVVRHGRRYAVRQHAPPPQRREVVFISPTDWVGSMVSGPSRMAKTWFALERSCTRRDLALHTYGYYVEVRKEVGPRYREALDQFLASRRDRLIGCIISGVASTEHYLMPSIYTALSHDLPVAVIDETGMPPNLRQLRRLPKGHLLRWYPAAGGIDAGRDVANALIALGHRHIALLTMAPGMTWADTRGGTFTQACAEAGLSSPVTIRVDTRAALDTARGSGDGAWIVTESAALQDRLESLGPEWYERDMTATGQVTGSLDRRSIARTLEPLMQRLLQNERVTAWVGIHDEFALDALSFLRHRGVSVPAHISVIGFDDTLEAFGSGLASYGFNEPAIVDAALDQLMGYGMGRQRRAEVVTVPGVLTARRTLGRIRG